MPLTRPTRPRNRLLDSLGRAERTAVLADCEPVQMQFGEVLCEPGDRIRDAYFPLGGAIALIARADRRAALEVGSVGNEGLFGFPIALGRQRQPLRAIVESPGPALRIDAARLREHLGSLPGLQRVVQRQLADLLSELARAAACNRFHVVEARLARWLLLNQDRAQSDEFDLTHEFAASMLGVRRVGVTQAAGALQRRRLIRYRRGHVTILNRSGLEAASCSCYSAAATQAAGA
ncbi:MAG: Crp/Fnr family transcriptional regulator [Steroidobacteraceae bacterium]|nr:Crp/Fnr family transcriptional regulator [Steroidobacteraceae bacterium]